MFRCALFAASVAVSLSFATAPLQAQQLRRSFPQNAYRGVIAFYAPPTVRLNGDEAQLGPGARIRDPENRLVLTGDVTGSKLVVNYTVDLQGLIKDIWILRSDEIANKPWPRNAEEAEAWSFDPIEQTWTKP